MLEVTGLSKTYGRNPVLRDISFRLDVSNTLVIIGPSGSGKSTLLRCVALLERADVGQIVLAGETLGMKKSRRGTRRMREHELARYRSEIGVVFQHFNLFPHLTALENVMIGLREVRKLGRETAQSRAVEFLAKVDIKEQQWSQYPATLSGGQQQRVAIARALVMRPKLMLFDEPTSALDAEMVREVLSVMEELSDEGMTMIVVTHELRFARHAADQLLFMEDGMIVESGSADQVFGSATQERTRRFLDAIR